MANYLVAFHGGGMPETVEEQTELLSAWNVWYHQLGDAVVDQGNPIRQSATIAADGATSVGGGANPVTGYTVLAAGSLDAAVALALTCPIRRVGGSIEVDESFSVR